MPCHCTIMLLMDTCSHVMSAMHVGAAMQMEALFAEEQVDTA
jgi:hypothetical protein